MKPGLIMELMMGAAVAMRDLLTQPEGTRIETPGGYVWRDDGPEGGFRFSRDMNAQGVWRGDAETAIADCWAWSRI